jgi:hypothetical protein
MHLTVEDLARFYFQDRLSKFCPTEHDRPNTYEKEMFRYGVQHAQANIEKLEAENARLREALEFYADPNSWVDESVTYVYSVIQYDDQDIPPEEHRLCDKHGGRRAREALNDLRKGGE